METQQTGRGSRSAWRWEITALAGSLISLAVIVVLLSVYNTKPIFQWHSVTLNALVSVLSTASKAALLFAVAEALSQWKWILFSKSSRPLIDLERIDEASRGPLGSLTLLLFSRQSSLLSLGAVITILALAMDPFAQQLIQHREEPYFTPDNTVQISRAQRYSRGTETPKRVPIGEPAFFDVKPDFSMQSAILYGIVQNNSIVDQQVTYACASGNCTWPRFESLAVCSTCNDLGSQLTRVDTSDFLYIALSDGLNSAAECGKGTTFQLPNGLLINNRNGLYAGDTAHTILMTTYGTGNASRTVSFKDNDRLIWSMTMLRLADMDKTSADWPNVPVQALECGLHYCVKQYDSQVVNGTLRETETNVGAPRDRHSWQPLGEDDVFNAGKLNFSTSDYDSLIFNNVSAVVRRTDLTLGNGYNVSQVSVDTLSAYLQQVFVGNDNISDPGCGAPEGFAQSMNGFVLDLSHLPSVIEVFNKSQDLNMTFQAIAKSMTNNIRANGDGNTIVRGELGVNTTYYRIQWPWIALHGILILAGGVLLAATIIATREADLPTWKSHSLPLLALDTEANSALAKVESVKIMENIATQQFVQFHRNDKSQAWKDDNL